MNFLFADQTPEERKKLIEAHAVRREKTTFKRTLSDEELSIDEKQFIRDNIDLARLQKEKAESADVFKAKIDALKQSMEERLERINSQKKEVSAVLYSIPQQPENKMLMVDVNGEIIDTRPLKPEERQARLLIADENGNTSPVPDEEGVAVTGSVEEQIDEMYSGASIAGSAPASDEVADVEFEEVKSVRPAEGTVFDEKGSLPGQTGDPGWEEFEAQKAAEFAAKEGKAPERPKKVRSRKKKSDETPEEPSAE